MPEENQKPPAENDEGAPATPPAPLLADNVVMGDSLLTVDEIIDRLGTKPPPEPGTQPVGEDPVLTERTMAELSVGKAHVKANEEIEATGTLPIYSPLLPERKNPVVDAARASVHARISAEIEAGRLAIARKRGEHEYVASLRALDDARRLAENGPADAGDLGYSAPRQ